MISTNLSRSPESIRDHKISWIEIAWRHHTCIDFENDGKFLLAQN